MMQLFPLRTFLNKKRKNRQMRKRKITVRKTPRSSSAAKNNDRNAYLVFVQIFELKKTSLSGCNVSNVCSGRAKHVLHKQNVQHV